MRAQWEKQRLKRERFVGHAYILELKMELKINKQAQNPVLFSALIAFKKSGAIVL